MTTTRPVERIEHLRDTVLIAHNDAEFRAACGPHLTWLLGEIADGLSDISTSLDITSGEGTKRAA